MQFLFAVAALASVVAANTVSFVNQDSTTRTIYFTPSPGSAEVDSLVVDGDSSASAEFATGWVGNFYSVSEGAENVPGMLGELTWNAAYDLNWFDVSAIVNPNDTNGVKEIFPANSNTPTSGCQTFPCDNAYNAPDDVQTKSTTESDLVCLIGNLSNERKRGVVARHTHALVHGHHM